MMVKRKVDILCVQETKWKGSKARNIGDGCKLFYHGEDGRRNGVGVILSEEYIGIVLEVKRVSDRMMYMNLATDGVMVTVISAYDPQVGCLMGRNISSGQIWMKWWKAYQRGREW